MIFGALLTGILLGCGGLSSAEATALPRFNAWVEAQARTLPRSLVTYNYSAQSDGVPAGPADLLIRIRHAASAFWDASAVNLEFPPGYYVATDPVSSRAWGGEKFSLSVVTLARGARYLDYRAAITDSGVIQELKAVGCRRNIPPDVDPENPYYASFHFSDLRLNVSAQCRSEVLAVLRRHQLSMVQYAFPGPLKLGDCLRKDDEMVAFILADDRAVDAAGTDILTGPTLPQVVPRLAGCVSRLFDEGLPHFFSQLPKELRKPLWPGQHLPNCSEYGSWKREHTFGCGRQGQAD